MKAFHQERVARRPYYDFFFLPFTAERCWILTCTNMAQMRRSSRPQWSSVWHPQGQSLSFSQILAQQNVSLLVQIKTILFFSALLWIYLDEREKDDLHLYFCPATKNFLAIGWEIKWRLHNSQLSLCIWETSAKERVQKSIGGRVIWVFRMIDCQMLLSHNNFFSES